MRVRIEAPIPGRSTVGIEIPNKQRIKVLLGDILNDVGYREFSGALPLPLGRDIAGNLLLEDLTRMPHLLIAGATGSGKSVAVNSFISSLILHKTPEEVRFLLVDPKLVELSGYNDIPHLLHPVITEPNKAILALNWAVEEMERRYEDLAEMGARDIRSYNEKIRSQRSKAELPPMPYIVVLIDELGDLMMVAGKEVESSIIRLAQKARAVGIHLILATQRPSVDVITALIKANCPARIALQVAQKTDSRTILDGNGAEQLLGQGDMLFRHPSRGQLIRAQVPLIEDNEVEDVVAYAKKLAKPTYITLEDPKGKMGELEAGDEELFEEAWQIIVESQKASASYLQRRLRIGYNKAARLIEAFEARGMIGPQIGSKPREIIGGTGQGRPEL
jgi:S-DNA-T family DNA segregation ATPase FtsK/SpoIIIE